MKTAMKQRSKISNGYYEIAMNIQGVNMKKKKARKYPRHKYEIAMKNPKQYYEITI